MDFIMLKAANISSIQKMLVTENTKALAEPLHCLHYHPIVVTKFCNMVLKTFPDESQLFAPKVRIKVGGHFFFGNNIPPYQDKPCNGEAHNEHTMLKMATASVVEGELG